MAGGLRFRHVEAGAGHVCGVTPDNRAYCWGWNDNGQLGDGTYADRAVPVAVASTLRFRQVSAGLYHTCGVTMADRAYCWGYNKQGQGGDRNRGSAAQAAKTSLRRPALSERERGCAPQLWRGDRSSGILLGSRELRDSSESTSRGSGGRRPRSQGGLAFLKVIAGETQRDGFSYSCGVTTDHRGYCWGDNLDGQLGDGTTVTRIKPTAVAGGIQSPGEPGADHTCGVSTGSVAYCWGFDYYGQLGDGGPLGDVANVHHTPSPVTGGLSFANVSVGRVHTCGVTNAGAAYCWGGDTAGQLGDGSPDFASSIPGAVVGPS